MRVSHAELRTGYGYAFKVLGFAAGAASDAADIVTWHDMRGLSGLETLVPRLDALGDGSSQPPEIRSENAQAIVLDARGASLLEIGMTAIDLGNAAAMDEGTGCVTLVDAVDQSFMPGLAGIAANNGVEAALAWREGNLVRQAIVSVTGEVKLRADPASHAAPALEGDTILFLYGHAARRCGLAEAPPTAEITPATVLAARAAESLTDGVDIDPVMWECIVALGRRLLVSESADSRQRGAGQGADVD